MTKRTKKKKECIYCKVNNKKSRDKTFKMIALDRPYINLWIHASCLKKIGGYDDLDSFLQENREIWYNERYK